MSTTTTAPDVAGARSPRRRLVTMLVPMLLVAAVAPGVVGFRWWTHPDLFADQGSSLRAAPAPLGRSTLSAAVTFPRRGESGTITFRSATAHLAEDTAAADVSLAVCHRDAGQDPVGGVRGEPGPACRELTPIVDGTRMTVGGGPERGDYVVAVITPTRPGTSRLTRVDLDYTLGRAGWWRHGTDTVRLDLTVRAR
ncbi:hypothetical protein H5V45_12545 [Nocardioides sp. KIGAM211]|uniref:Uncharacterized protein n=1 Tax=Nocardioides luti TaxID=2761101 RepID=A0A7X0RHB2_9ACTN|nr:hypothetical protein [Nocardioides luti]MBB6628150.1 hypothetical protein [Nocardioides luti]